MTLTRLALGLVLAAALLPATAGARPASGIDGVYRVTWTEQELIAHGASARYAHINVGYAHGQSAVWTMTLDHGQLRLTSTPPTCLGTYAVAGFGVSILQKQHCNGLVVARWTLTARLLHLKVTKATDPGDRVLFGGKPWTKLG